MEAILNNISKNFKEVFPLENNLSILKCNSEHGLNPKYQIRSTRFGRPSSDLVPTQK